MPLATIITLLQAALALLTLAYAHPELGQSVRDSALQISQEAIVQATAALSAQPNLPPRAPTPPSPSNSPSVSSLINIPSPSLAQNPIKINLSHPSISLTINGSEGAIRLPHNANYTIVLSSKNVTSCAASTYGYADNSYPWNVPPNVTGNSSSALTTASVFWTLSCTGVDGSTLVKTVTVIANTCVADGRDYPEGTILPYSLPTSYNIRSQAAIPESAMMVVSCVACNPGRFWVRYQCTNGNWVKIDSGYDYSRYPLVMKPVIYLYPTKKEEVTVHLHYNGRLTSTDPPYDEAIGGWRVIARPDGTLTNLADYKEYSYLFWEGADYPLTVDQTRGFVVKGSDTREFLQSKLVELGLIPREYNEFIAFWLPRMEHNAYNFIQFVGDEYTKNAPLSISPKPDSMLRVFMAYKPLNQYVKVAPQKIAPFVRKGFSVIEWGGTELVD